jgi:hypothetical protein
MPRSRNVSYVSSPRFSGIGGESYRASVSRLVAVHSGREFPWTDAMGLGFVKDFRAVVSGPSGCFVVEDALRWGLAGVSGGAEKWMDDGMAP